MAVIDNLLHLLAAGNDGALLRFSLGNEYGKAENWDEAIRHLTQALQFDPAYSAAWKLQGKALAAAGRQQEAIEAWQQGMAVAEGKGDVQAVKEMRVFLKRARAVLENAP